LGLVVDLEMEKTNKAVVFSPFRGEFSCELGWHMPHLRLLCETKYKDYYKIVIGQIGKRAMYRDFVNEYVSYPFECVGTDNSKDPWNAQLGGSNEHLTVFYNTTLKEINERFDFIEEYNGTLKTVFDENPKGIYKHFVPTIEFDLGVQKELLSSFIEPRPIISLMARLRHRYDVGDFPDGESWKRERWIELIKLLVDDLGCNVALIGVPRIRDYPGNYDFKNEEDLKEYSGHLTSFIGDDEDSLARQISILRNTKCSIYGSTGAAILPFFVGSPTFIQSTKEDGWRFYFEWQKRLTNNHENVIIFYGKLK
jgi:hypothetical protein